MPKNKIFSLNLLVFMFVLLFLVPSVFSIGNQIPSQIPKLTLEESVNYALVGSLLSIYILWKFIATFLWLNRHPLRIWGLGFTGSKMQLERLYEEYSAIKNYLRNRKRRIPFFLFVDRFSLLIFLLSYYIVYSIFVRIKNIFPVFFLQIFDWSYRNTWHTIILITVFCVGVPVLMPLLLSKMVFQYDLYLRKRIKKEMDRNE